MTNFRKWLTIVILIAVSTHSLAAEDLDEIKNANPLSSVLRTIPNTPDHSKLNSAQLRAVKQYAKLAANAVCTTLKPGQPYKCGGFCDEFPQTTVIDRFDVDPEDIQGYIARDDLRKAIVISIRGTASLPNAIVDAQFKLIPYPSKLVKKAKVHEGFYKAYQGLKKVTIPALTSQLKQYPSYDVEVVGHSLGGAMAVMQAADIYENVPAVKKDRLYLVTVGEPRVGNDAFAKWISSAGFVSKRLVYRRDLVPHFPPRFFGYENRGPEIHTSARTSDTIQCKGGEDERCANGEPVLGLNALDHAVYLDVDMLKCAPEHIKKTIIDLLKKMFDDFPREHVEKANSPPSEEHARRRRSQF
ncbi:uncharacterized protein VTP21DRAFT_1853 [Calcarisporiella thermophila]|uniref:uncharacterized protein n=1 Tax=Calcarisporiella thermophila TaxID=911321 RepID=UPI00374410AA